MTRKLGVWVCALAIAWVSCGKSGEVKKEEPVADQADKTAPDETAPDKPADQVKPEEPKAAGFAAANDCKELCTNYVKCEGWSDEDGNALTGQAAVDSCAGLCDAPPEGTTFDTGRDCLMEATSCEAFKKCEAE